MVLIFDINLLYLITFLFNYSCSILYSIKYLKLIYFVFLFPFNHDISPSKTSRSLKLVDMDHTRLTFVKTLKQNLHGFTLISSQTIFDLPKFEK